MVKPIFDAGVWANVPFQFWSVVWFVLGCTVGSFLNVCIHRLPLGESIVSPPSHCPHCRYSIPWFLNIPLMTWVYLRGKCANCGAPIAVRYFLVELLTGVLFLACWLRFGHVSAALVFIYAAFLAGLVVAGFIDYEHTIIPDEITLGGMVAGFLCSFLVPQLQGVASLAAAMKLSLIGMGAGVGVIYLIVRGGKLVFGRHRVSLPAETKIIFTETAVLLPDKTILYEELFYRESDTIVLKARTVELVDRCYQNVVVRLSPNDLWIDDERLNPEEVAHLEAVSSEIILPREAMGFGDVKFMGTIGAFLGWQGVVFSLIVGSLVGAVAGGAFLALKKRESSRVPFGPYLAIGATLWIFYGPPLVRWYERVLTALMGVGPH